MGFGGRRRVERFSKLVASTKVEPKMGHAGEGGVIELWERRTDGGLGCGEKIDIKCFGFKIISRKSICFEKGENIYLIKRNKSDLKIKKNVDVENYGEVRGFGFIYIY